MELSTKSVPELEKMHQELDERVKELRARQALIHAETVRQESLNRKAGDPSLLQRVGQVSEEQQIADLAAKDPEKAKRLIEALTRGLAKKEE